MASQIGLGKHWFHKDHFDIPVNRRVEIESHCLHVSPRSIVRLIRAHHRRQAEFNQTRKPGMTAEKLAEKCGVQWTENMDHEAVLYEYYKKKGAQKLHFCPDWDFMTIHDKSPEFDACTCEGL